MIGAMTMSSPADYLAGLSATQHEELSRVNGAGLAALHEYLTSNDAVAFLGAGVSVPLYPLWDGLIRRLVDAASGRLEERDAATLWAMARQSPEEVVEIVRQQLGTARYREVLREVLRVRTDSETGRSWTPIQELVCRCAFKAVVTTNYDPGIVDARMRVRSGASATGFITWEDELGLDRWRSGEVFGEVELPVLFAHGQHNRPDGVVLATTEYRRAYAGKLPHVLARLVEDGHLVWIGFSFTDQRVAAILREIADRTGTRADPGGAPRHVAVMAWDPASEGNSPQILARQAESGYGALVVLYPAPGGDHGRLGLLLSTLTDDRFPAASDFPSRKRPSVNAPEQEGIEPGVAERWMPRTERVEHFTGRVEELARLDRWAADPQVRLVGVVAWGGAGKTALVTHWVQATGGPRRRVGLQGVFGWSFYADPSAEHWAEALLEWARHELSIPVTASDRPGAAVLGVLRRVPLLLVLDGMEVVQEGPAENGFGRLLDGTLREVLSGACLLRHGGFVVLTSRFPFADLEIFDGDSSRMLDVPPFTPTEGSALLATAGADWLSEGERRALVRAVDGHALAVAVLAGLLAARPPASDLATLHSELVAAAPTSKRVGRVLRFYADQLSDSDRYLLAAVSLFARPVSAAAALTVAEHEAFAGRLAGWTTSKVEIAVRDRLGGLATWHPDGTISAHPLVRTTFRPLVMAAAETAVQTALTGMPTGELTSRTDALRVVEAIELLVDADQWDAADDMYTNRCRNGDIWKNLPAARLGQRASTALVATPARRNSCVTYLGSHSFGYYLNEVGLNALRAGNLVTAQQYLRMAESHARDVEDMANLSVALLNMAECLTYLGEVGSAQDMTTDAFACAQRTGDWRQIRTAHTFRGWLAGLAGDTAEADQQFLAADQIEVANDQNGDHLFSGRGIRWAEGLTLTDRIEPARALTRRNLEICRENGWNADMARCNRQLGRLALAFGDTAAAGEHLAAAIGCLRDGDYLTELAITLADLAEHALASGDSDAAERHSAEAIAIAGPRSLVPARSAALAVWARTRAGRAIANPDYLAEGRDAADAALRLAVHHHLAWHELDALRAHAVLDRAEGVDHGWAARVDALNARLIPPGLDPNPLATVERLVAAREAAEQRATKVGKDEGDR